MADLIMKLIKLSGNKNRWQIDAVKNIDIPILLAITFDGMLCEFFDDGPKNMVCRIVNNGTETQYGSGYGDVNTLPPEIYAEPVDLNPHEIEWDYENLMLDWF